MARFLGPNMDVSGETGPEALDYVGAGALARVRAWPVLPLQGASFYVRETQDIASSLRTLLAVALPDLEAQRAQALRLPC